MFPANAAGFALVILRSCVALELFLAIPAMNPNIPYASKVTMVALLAFALCIGAYTPAGCTACVLLHASVLQANGGFGDLALIVPMALPISLFLLGPGAYSVDAKRYGRRIISAPKI